MLLGTLPCLIRVMLLNMVRTLAESEEVTLATLSAVHTLPTQAKTLCLNLFLKDYRPFTLSYQKIL